MNVALAFALLILAQHKNIAIAHENICEATQQYLTQLFDPAVPARKRRSNQCFITDIERDSDLVWIDVRRASQLEYERIPGALNISPAALSSKSFLKYKRLLLISNGFGRAALSELCAELIDRGFKSPSILLDGIRHKAVELKISPHRPRASLSNVVSVSDVIRELSQNEVFLVADNEDVASQLSSELAGVHQLNAKTPINQIAELQKLNRKHGKEGLIPIVLFTSPENGQVLMSFQRPSVQNNVYFLTHSPFDLLDEIRKLKSKPNKTKIPNRYKCTDV